MSNFLVHPKTYFYSTHGEISAEMTYDAFKRNGLRKDFYITGFGNNGEVKAHISNMVPIDVKEYYKITVKGVGTERGTLYAYKFQKFMDSEGNIISVSSICPDSLVLSLNGNTAIEYIEFIEEKATFYNVITESPMENVYMTNIILFNTDTEERTVTEADDSNFFHGYSEKR